MKIDKIGYFNLFSEDIVIDCGNNYFFYKIKILIGEFVNFFKIVFWCNKDYFYKVF